MMEFLRFIKKLGIEIKILDKKVFYKLIKLSNENNVARDLYETIFTDFNERKLDYSSKIEISSDFTIEYLKRLGFEWPDIDYEYIRRYIEYFEEIGYWEV